MLLHYDTINECFWSTLCTQEGSTFWISQCNIGTMLHSWVSCSVNYVYLFNVVIILWVFIRSGWINNRVRLILTGYSICVQLYKTHNINMSTMNTCTSVNTQLAILQ